MKKIWTKASKLLPSDSRPKICKAMVNKNTIAHFEAWYNHDLDNWIDWCGDTNTDDNWEVLYWMEIPE